MDKQAKNLFSDFTNLYSLSKTLRFELKPLPETVELLQKTNLMGKTPIQIDQEIDELYHKEMKPLFDQLHEIFINKSLKKVSFETKELESLEAKYLIVKTLNKDRKNNTEEINRFNEEIKKIQEKLRADIVKKFNNLGEEWKEKYREIKLNDDGFKILTNAKILNLLKILHPKKSQTIDKFKKFFTYFSGFNLNRENYYSAEEKATGVANRIININLSIFFDNKQKFEEISEKIPKLKEFEKYFTLANYQNCLNQEAIENFNQNVIGKINLEKNLFCQREKKIDLPNLEKHQKQIGCRTKEQRALEEKGESVYPKYLEKVGLGFQITKDHEQYQIWEALTFLTNELKPKLEKLKTNYQEFFDDWDKYRLGEIWFRKESINNISGKWFGGENWYILADSLINIKVGRIDNGEYKIPSFVNLLDLKNAMDNLNSYKPEDLFKEEYKIITKNSPSLFESFLSVWENEIDKKFNQIESFVKDFQKYSKEPFDKNKKENDRSVHLDTVKNLVEEGYLRLYQLTKYHNLLKKGELVALPTESKFYDELNDFWDNNDIVMYHKAFQSTLTKKPYSQDKIKLNFENGCLLGGFSDGQEKNKSGVIIKRGDKFYLGILRNRQFFRTDKLNPLYQNTNNNDWQRLILTNLKFQTLAGKGFLGKYSISYGRLGKSNPSKAISCLRELIKSDYLQKYPQLKVLIDKDYKNKKDFDLDIKNILNECFTMKFIPINYELLQQGLKNEDLFLFEITNNDFSEFKKSKNKNIHTIYWQALFGKDNLEKIILALNGGATVFFRKGQAGKLMKKFDNSGKEILDAKRYATDKYFLHVSVTVNYGKPKNLKFKELINQKLRDNLDEINVIGIDRGEKNLLYYSVVTPNGVIIEQGSLNMINGVNYNEKLQAKQNKRNQARLDWEEIGNIKNFKEGYLSQAINKIYELIIKHQAIVVMENLNSEFKAKRAAKVEKSVYKKFELALAKKLNHLILKDREANEEGGVLNAYQLTPRIDAVDISKFDKANQWGILFYVRANYTSTTDPLTGWRKHLYLANSETMNKTKDFFNPETGAQINYDPQRNCFCFSYRQVINWQLFAYEGLERFYWDNKIREIKKYHLHGDFEQLFAKLDKTKNINQQIYDDNYFNWKNLVFFWNLLNQIRNMDKTKAGDENDFLQSPVWSEKFSKFFDSRKVVTSNLPNNGDANGAYNIARKGIVLLSRIKNCKDISKFGIDYYISDSDWDNYLLQNSPN